MFIARAALTTATTAAVGVVSATQEVTAYSWVNESMPVLVGVITVLIVRALFDMDSKTKRSWNYNVLTMLLCSIFTGVMVHEYHLTSGAAMLLAMGTGSSGVGVISYGKPFLAAIVGKLNEAVNGSSGK